MEQVGVQKGLNRNLLPWLDCHLANKQVYKNNEIDCTSATHIQPYALWNQTPSLDNRIVHRIAMRRGMTSDHFRVKFGVDYGQSFLKVTLTLTDASWHCAGAQHASLNGGKKTMLLAVCQAPETYSNLKALFTLLNAPGDLEYVYACDVKVTNMATGLS